MELDKLRQALASATNAQAATVVCCVSTLGTTWVSPFALSHSLSCLNSSKISQLTIFRCKRCHAKEARSLLHLPR